MAHQLTTAPLAGPKASPQPPLPADDPLTADQWSALLAIADAVVPSIQPQGSGQPMKHLILPADVYSNSLKVVEKYAKANDSEVLARAYLAERATDMPNFKDLLHSFLALYVPSDLKSKLLLSLNLLNYRITALVVTGRPTLFAAQPINIRQDIIRSWMKALIPDLRLMFKSLSLLIKQNWLKSSPTLGKILSFPRVPVHGTAQPGHAFSFVQIPPGSEAEVIETDVVIVGSGCGGGVVAKNLAEAGYRVIVVDKAYHFPSEHFPMAETDGLVHMFMNGGALFSDDNSTVCVAGQAWGGGGTINWSASLQTQGYVRKEWSDAGLPFFTSSDFQDSLDSVCNRMGASTEHIVHNKQNDVLLEGSRKLGWTAKTVPQNTGGNRHYCGYCTMGCASCEKMGPVSSFLPDACRAGAKFIEGYDVYKVLFEKDKKTGKKTAVGVTGTWTSRDEHGGLAGAGRTKRRVTIKAKRVVVSCGTMQTPCLLMRSGLKNRHIGRNLKLHPVNVVGAVYDEEIRPWEGGILTAVVSSFENLDGNGHGVKLEATTMLPSLFLSFATWLGGLEYKLLAPKMKNMVGHISLARDEGSGRIYLDPTDRRCRYTYTPSKKDKRHIIEGMIALAKINYIEGAREIFTSVPGIPTFIRPEHTKSECEGTGINCPTFNAFLDRIRKVGLPLPESIFLTAHQMGSCRMGATPSKGAVDTYGRMWEADNLLVADASVFPSASGVNPMVTNMAISEWIAKNIIKDLKLGDVPKSRL